VTKNGMVEYQLGGVIALPATCTDAEKKLLGAMVALVEAMGGQISGRIVHRLTTEDYKTIEAELESWHKGGKTRSKAKPALRDPKGLRDG